MLKELLGLIKSEPRLAKAIAQQLNTLVWMLFIATCLYLTIPIVGDVAKIPDKLEQTNRLMDRINRDLRDCLATPDTKDGDSLASGYRQAVGKMGVIP